MKTHILTALALTSTVAFGAAAFHVEAAVEEAGVGTLSAGYVPAARRKRILLDGLLVSGDRLACEGDIHLGGGDGDGLLWMKFRRRDLALGEPGRGAGPGITYAWACPAGVSMVMVSPRSP